MLLSTFISKFAAMFCHIQIHRLPILRYVRLVTVLLTLLLLPLIGCSKEEKNSDMSQSLNQALRIQRIQNLHPADNHTAEMEAIVDSMRHEGKTPYYFAALNVLIDHLFSDGRFAEADSLAVRMRNEAIEMNDSLSLAMAKRVRAQILYKLSQPERALEELEPASRYITNPLRSGPAFSTAANINEWMWIISRSLSDTVRMNKVGREYARLVAEYSCKNGCTDTTGHFPVTAIAFEGEALFSEGDHQGSKRLLEKADTLIRPSLPARAYEHLFEVRCRIRAAEKDWEGALADADTLLATHKDFPWFYLNDLILKAHILTQAGRHQESAATYSRYIALHDSLYSKITDKRLNNLTVLYRSEIDREQQRAQTARMIGFGSVIVMLIILLIVTLIHADHVRKSNRRLVERLKDFDRAAESVYQSSATEPEKESSVIERLDRHLFIDRPYTDPGLGRKELADFTGLSQEAVGNLIKEEKGCSVKSYINSFRLDEARRMLESDTPVSIAEIACSLGFGTPRTLQRAFKERFDMTPTQYRDVASRIKTDGSRS
ncbi:MAG: helix-turn-helix domain-containing protein [Muribaculaceae bacterium]|nr:helix-turn-helix domain-containing protein [Muribaculaceae bacterium]